jgi:hypothetical protein
MTERKFTPPAEFPAEYVDGDGTKIVILGRTPAKDFPLVGYFPDGTLSSWTEGGHLFLRDLCAQDLHDLPKRITTWHNVYDNSIGPQRFNRRHADDRCGRHDRLCVYRIERDEDGSNPEIFVEEAE